MDLLIDGESCTFAELIECNIEDGVQQLPAEQIDEIKSLKVGESCEIGIGGAFGMSTCERIA